MGLSGAGAVFRACLLPGLRLGPKEGGPAEKRGLRLRWTPSWGRCPAWMLARPSVVWGAVGPCCIGSLHV